MDLSSIPQWVVASVCLFSGYGALSGVLWVANRINKRHEVAMKLAGILAQHGYTRVAAILEAYALGNLQKAANLAETLADDIKDPEKLGVILDEVFDKRLTTLLASPAEAEALLKKVVPRVTKAVLSAAVAAAV